MKARCQYLLSAASCVFLSSHMGVAAPDSDKVIYGEDNRMDLYDERADPLMVTLARSTAMLIRTSDLKTKRKGFKLPDASLGEELNLCRSERFRNQPAPGFCSGFLVAPDVMVTAGHCVRSQSDCESISFVFDFSYRNSRDKPTQISKDQVYQCKKLIARELNSRNRNDYAVVQLDRTTDYKPLEVNESGKLKSGSLMTVIGHPSGLPTKITSNGKVRDSSSDIFFTAAMDTYAGNSGSAVFNSRTGQVEGILVRGETDYVSRGRCRVSNQCEESGCRGEDVTKISQVLPFLPGFKPKLPEGEAFVVLQNELSLEIPDDDLNGVEITLDPQAKGAITGVSLAVEIAHPYLGDLVIELVHPEGKVITLRSREGQSDSDLRATYGIGGISVSDLKQLNNMSAEGEWKLRIYDQAASDFGKLTSVSLTVYAN